MEPIDFNQSTNLPLLTLGSNNAEFDYLQDLDYLEDAGSSGSASIMNEVASTSVSPPTSACQETRPSCGHCTKTGLKCEYPLPQHKIPLFSLQDIRFFQHFLLTCSPHQPLGNDSIWTHEVPCLSQNVVHAILGLAASELMIQDPSLVTFAMAHRLKAIKAIKRTLTDVPKTNTFDEGNALLATCYALTFQSVMLDDGMAEFMIFCRGIVIVAIQMYCKGAKFIFSNFHGDDHVAHLQPLLETLITNIANALYTSSSLAYQMLCKHYGWWMQIPHKNFQSLVNGENQVCLLLASHWIALKQIMAIITDVEHKQRPQRVKQKDGDMDIGMVRWLKHINKHVDMDHQQYNQWPLWVEVQLDIDLGYFGKEPH
ncbi:C6 zinc finger protein [Xylaria longipes]|nr:C6 zinc finger protein [Xylaria longipes]